MHERCSFSSCEKPMDRSWCPGITVVHSMHYSRVSPMASFKRFSHTFLGFSLLTAGLFVAGACSVNLDAGLTVGKRAPEEDTSFSTGSGGTTGTGTGVIVPPPDNMVGASSFAGMCGGGCMLGDPMNACPPPGDPMGPPASCQIVPTKDGVKAMCLPPGMFQEGEPCESATNCAPGLGCARKESNVGVCLPYCCNDIESCAAGTYCMPTPMAEDALGPEPLRIPVCVPVVPCKLLDDSMCTQGRTCALVRADGTTSCVEPGPGKEGEACPCSAGHVCVLSSNTCRQLCHVGGNDCTDGGVCQGGSEGFPDGIGLCVK